MVLRIRRMAAVLIGGAMSLGLPASGRVASVEVGIAPAHAEQPAAAPAKRKSAQQAKDGTRSEQVLFKAGQTGTSIKGKITGYESVLYRVGAEAGQTMSVALKPSNLATYFNVYEPGKGPGEQALATGSATGPMVPDLNRFKGKLPTSGTYTISVYMMRSAARRNERSNYVLDISISALGDASRLPPVQRDYADGLQGGPDYWEVRTAHPTGKVELRTSPSGAASEVGNLASGTVLRNLGCRMNEARRWCHVETLSAPGLSGWTAGESLRESSYVGTQQPLKSAAASEPGNFDRPVGGVRPQGSGFTATGLIPCARDAGQPMAQCEFGVVRKGNGNGVATVFWPDGGTRVIAFESGTPVSFDRSRADGDVRMKVDRKAGLLTVTIGAQRFEIPDAVIYGG